MRLSSSHFALATTLALLQILLGRSLSVYRHQLLLPTRKNTLIHSRAGNLIYADEHGLTRLPARGAVLYKVSGNLVEPVSSGDDLVVLA